MSKSQAEWVLSMAGASFCLVLFSARGELGDTTSPSAVAGFEPIAVLSSLCPDLELRLGTVAE